MNFFKKIPLNEREWLTCLLLFIFVLILVLGSRLSRLTYTHAVSSNVPVDLILYQELNIKEFGNLLADSGLIEQSAIDEIIWAGNLYGWKKFPRGRYLVDGDYSYDVLLSRIGRGIQDPVFLTIPPGIDKSYFFEHVSEKMHFDSTGIAKVFQDSLFISRTNTDENSIFGRMFPDSYSFYWTSEPETVITKILNTFKNKVVDRYQNRFDELDRPVEDIVTLASIIEWEAHHEDEKPKISGLYWNRLNRGMRLQADPTVLFALGEKRRILFEDYKIDHPYNTYIRRGLPPGPITNPSLSSIEAALYPQDHDYLFMVANPEGYHVFTKTFEEHKKESAKWRQWIREQYRLKKENEENKTEDPSS